MSASVAYIDTSAYVKLPLWEPEAPALSSEMARWAVRSSSALMAVEAVRAVARIEPAMVEETRGALDRLSLIPLSDQVLRLARDIAGPSLRSLDAIHLATAASLGDDLGVILTYDQRMMDAATSLGMPVAAPA